jgi:hypothetical protein
MSNIIKVINKETKNQCNVYLGNPQQNRQTIFNASIECKPSKIYNRVFNSKPSGHYNIKVDITNNQDGLKFKDKSLVLTVQVGTQSGSSLNFDINQSITPFSLVFDPMQVIDGSTKKTLQKSGNGNYSEKYGLDYQIAVTDLSNNSIVYTINGKVAVTLNLSASEALAYVAVLVATNTTLTYSDQEANGYDQPTEGERWPKVAELKLHHASDLRCAPAANLTFWLEASQQMDPTLVEGGVLKLNNQEVVIGLKDDGKGGTMPEWEESHPVKARGSVVKDPDSMALQIAVPSNHRFVVEGLYSRNDDTSDVNVVTIPIHIDMAKLKNPNEDQGIINLSVKHSQMGSAAIESLDAIIPLNKNASLTALSVTLKDKDITGQVIKYSLSLTNSDCIELQKIPIQGQANVVVDIVFGNEAQTTETGYEDAGIIIGGFKLGEVRDVPDEVSGINRIKTRQGLGQGVDKIFKLSDNGIHTLRCKKRLTGNHSNSFELAFSYCAKDIPAIVPYQDLNGRYIYDAIVEIPFSYKYLIDRTGVLIRSCEKNPSGFWKANEGFMQEGNCLLHVRLERALAPEWLCLDFGTSAVVALYGAIGQQTTPLLALNKYRKSKFITSAYRGDSSRQMDIAESSDDFLPSVTYFNDHNTGDYQECKPATDFDGSAIWFSPTTGMTAGAIDYQLPSLKLILGFDTLPDIFSDNAHKNFKYLAKDPNDPKNLIPRQLKYPDSNELTEICDVNNLIEIIYHQLFEYYVRPTVDEVAKHNHRPLEKIILTIPNTFTPQNVEMLRKLIPRLMPTIRMDQIRFVSESDAVACYYLANEQYFPCAPDRYTSFEEDLLVYDMGAGTLDLTYLHRVRTATNTEQSQHITIEGKMGVSKAGNYLDYIIAEILVKLINKLPKKNRIDITETPVTPIETKITGDKEEDDGHTLSTTGRLDTSLNLDGGSSALSTTHSEGNTIQNVNIDWNAVLALTVKERGIYANEVNEFKGYVSKKVKPILSKPDSTPLPDYEHGTTYKVPFTVKDIISHPLFKKYIEDATSNVLDQFAKMFSKEPGKLPVDTLIFSGRSTHLRQIRQGVVEYLTKKGKNPKCADCRFADVGMMANLNPSTLEPIPHTNRVAPKVQSDDGLKTSVAQGALAYVSFFGDGGKTIRLEGRNIYAHYGMLWEDVNGFHYRPFIQSRNDAKIKASKATNGVFIDEYEITKQFNFHDIQAGHIWLVQTYSDNPAKDWEDGNREMISVLFSRDCGDFMGINSEFTLTLKIDSLNRLIFKIGAQNLTLSPHVDFNDMSLRMSLWPVIFKL